MNDERISLIVAKAIKEAESANQPTTPIVPPISPRNRNRPCRPKYEFSKKLMIGASLFYLLVCAVSIVSWFATGDWPREIIEYFTWPYAAAIASYMGKSAYENKPKIEGPKGG